jgi:predicted CoA-binding protein
VNFGKILTDDDAIATLLRKAKTIAVVGLSPKPERDSNMVGRYLQDAGYRVIPVRPGQKTVLGETAYKRLSMIPEPVDIIAVFRAGDQVMPHAREAVLLKPNCFWMQLNIQNKEAADLLTRNGIDVVMNSCIKVEHEVLIKQTVL